MPAYAQTGGGTRADPGEVERRILQNRPRPPAQRPPALAPPGAGPQAPGGPALSFVLTSVVIEGATVFSPAALAPHYARFLARAVGPAEMEEIAAGITQAYGAAGYFISRAIVPPQQVEGGVLRVRVIEGFLSAVRFTGAESQRRLLGGYGTAITRGRPARLDAVERGLLLINDLPGIEVRDVQVARLDDDGAYELHVTLDYDAADGTVNLDNRGTPEVGRLQAWLSGNANSAMGWGERLQLALATVPDSPRELRYAQVSYAQPLGHGGSVLDTSVSGSLIDAGGTLAAEDAVARGLSITTRLSYPLILSRRQSLYVRGAFEVHEIKEDRFEASTIDDSLRVLRLQGDTTLKDNWDGTTFLAVELSRGLDILGASDRGDAILSRPDGDGVFTKFRFDVVRVQEISGPVSLRMAARAQSALDALLSREEFLLGGSLFGRAYDFGEISGEDGIAGSLELRYGDPEAGGVIGGYQVYGFYDLGAVWNRNTEAGMHRDSLASLGGGVRLDITRGIQAAFEVAQPLTRAVESTGDTGMRVFFSLGMRF